MKKIGITFILLAGLLFFNSCFMDYSADNQQVLGFEDEVADRCSLPASKVVTVTSREQISGYGSSLPSLFSSIVAGGRTKRYSDSYYSGTLKSIGFTIYQNFQPSGYSGVYYGILDITYRGTVYRL